MKMFKSTTVFLMCLLSLFVSGMTVDDARQLCVKFIVVKTVNGEIPTCDYVSAPEGQDGTTTTNQAKVPARMFMILGNDTLYNSGEYKDGKSGLTIRIRGNSSATLLMKPYKLKLEKKADLLFRNNDVYKDKEWLLLHGYRLNTMVGNKVSELVGVSWVPKCEYVNVFLNDDYQGIYILSESVKRSDGRINVDKDNGYIFENDAYWWNNSVYADTHIIDLKYKYTFKYPDSDDITPYQINYISETMDAVERSILDGTYSEKIDVESFAKWLLVQDILKNVDVAGSNMYLAKEDENTKVEMICPWDFDGIFNDCMYYSVSDANGFSPIHSNNLFYYPYLFSSPNKTFEQTYNNMWNNLKESLFTDISAYIKTFQDNTNLANDIQKSRDETKTKWGIAINDISTETRCMLSWISNRRAWLDNNMDITTQIHTITPTKKSDPSMILYDVSGKKQKFSNKGIMIVKGKKQIMIK